MNLWENLKFEVTTCNLCKLSHTRKNIVLGEGDINSPIMFIGEAPNDVDEKMELPFCDESGKLFTKILNSVKIDRNNVYLTNIVKCKTPSGRNPEEDEIIACSRYLETQIALINPKIIVAVGAVAANFFLKEHMKNGIKGVRGVFYKWYGDIKVIAIFDPNFLLRNSSTKEGSPKQETWKDIQNIRKEYDKYLEKE
ncbi:MAG: uracil-DNA glycosylase [Fusobacteria bacterium]|nr:uracil-DNA glycosylase [Fusobacteriota bacterium]